MRIFSCFGRVRGAPTTSLSRPEAQSAPPPWLYTGNSTNNLISDSNLTLQEVQQGADLSSPFRATSTAAFTAENGQDIVIEGFQVFIKMLRISYASRFHCRCGEHFDD